MNTKHLSVVLLIAGIGIGYFANSLLISPEKTVTNEDDVDMEMDMSAPTMHTHTMLEVDQSKPIPALEIEALKDVKDGYNIHLITKNYTFTPETVNTDPESNTGHAHIYVNDVKVARLYGEWFNLSGADLSEGENVVQVTLNANDHSEWVIDGQHISDEVTLVK